MYYVYFTEDGSICTKFETEELANELINANPNGIMDKIEAPEDHETVNYIWVKNNICIVETQEEINEEKWITIRQKRTKLLLDSDCHNSTNQSGKCNKGTKQTTKDLLFLTQEQQLDRVKSLRTTCSNGSKVAEKPMMNSGSCVVIE